MASECPSFLPQRRKSPGKISGRESASENGVRVDELHINGNRANSAPPREPLALSPVAPGVTLWWCSLERPADEITHFDAWLSSPEHARAERFGTEALRHRYIVGRAMLRLLLGRTLGIAAKDVSIRRGVRGRPELADMTAGLDFNVSHTKDVALIGIADALPTGARIGVDVERADRDVNSDGLARKFLTERERAGFTPLAYDERRRRFLRLWTCKEAMSKATGDALSAPFQQLDVTLGEIPRLVAGPPPYAPEAWRLVTAPVPEGFIATVAIWRSAAGES